MTILDKIKSLRDKFWGSGADPQDVVVIDGWMEEAKRLFIIKSLKNHDGIKYVLDIFEKEIEKINEQLQKSYSKDLPDKERDRLLDKKDLAQKYLNIFLGVDEQLEELEESVDNETGVDN
jgi:uncharacterized protein YnzC (UPF0291/DUF896 family)